MCIVLVTQYAFLIMFKWYNLIMYLSISIKINLWRVHLPRVPAHMLFLLAVVFY